MARSAPDIDALRDCLSGLVGPNAVSADPAERTLHSQDVYAQGGLVDLVVSPATEAEASACIAAICAAGLPVYPRGGGMSYTAGYTPARPGGVCLDTNRMDRVIEINAKDMYVRVEAGCSWAKLARSLKGTGLRTPFWGPLSGLSSTIGGGVSQHNAFFGAGSQGPLADSVISVSVALPDGRVLRTGSAGAQGISPFFRHYGPDLTGLFCGDCGALGVKLEVTLRLMPAPAFERWGSYAFESRDAMAQALVEAGRSGLACELFGFDPGLTAIRLQRASLMGDAKTLGKVVTGQGNLVRGLAEGAKMALAGRSFLAGADYNLHFVTEGGSRTGVDDAHASLHALITAQGGKPVAATIPKVIRANPFTPLNNMIGPQAERWVPVHGIVPHSAAATCWAEIDACFAALQPRFDVEGVTTGQLLTTISTNGVLIEPVFIWPDVLFALHERTVESGYLKGLKPRPANPAATALVAEARAAVIEVFGRHGGVHFQIGRAYPYAETRTPAVLALLTALKRHLDPQGLINPGVLGLDGGRTA